VLFRVEEVRRAQVRVALGGSGRDAGRLDGDLDAGSGEVLLVELDAGR
jgi:hypothetical protein